MNRHLVVALTTLLLAGKMVVGQTAPAPDPVFTEQFQAGKRALSEGRYKDALGAFKKANKAQNDSCGACYLGMAAADMKLRDSSRALEACDRAISVAQTDSSRAAAHNLKGNVLATGVQGPTAMAKAEEEYRAAIQLDHKRGVVSLESRDRADQTIEGCSGQGGTGGLFGV